MTERYYFSNVADSIDRARVLRWLSEESYWPLGRSRSIQDAAMDASRNYGVYDGDSGEQVAYARVVTDGVTFAEFCDVFVSSPVRGRGLGKLLVAGVVTELESLGLKRVLLSTSDAHGLYAQFGFTALQEPSKMMAKATP
jgi:N-acetylglutamate synthase-like GNAT family acetyltransferase